MEFHEAFPEMARDVRKLIAGHRAFYEVSAHQVVVDERPAGRAATARRVHAGFNVDVYGIKTSPGIGPTPELELACAALKQLANTILADTRDSCSIEAIPFRSTIFIEPKEEFRRLALLRIKIGHYRGLDQPCGDAERDALRNLERQLRGLGVKAGTRSA